MHLVAQSLEYSCPSRAITLAFNLTDQLLYLCPLLGELV